MVNYCPDSGWKLTRTLAIIPTVVTFALVVIVAIVVEYFMGIV